jgi:hypothetical protein
MHVDHPRSKVEYPYTYAYSDSQDNCNGYSLPDARRLAENVKALKCPCLLAEVVDAELWSWSSLGF